MSFSYHPDRFNSSTFPRAEVAELFEPSIEAAMTSISYQVETTGGFVKVRHCCDALSSHLMVPVRLAGRRIRCEPLVVWPVARASRTPWRHREQTGQPNVSSFSYLRFSNSTLILITQIQGCCRWRDWLLLRSPCLCSDVQVHVWCRVLTRV